MAAFTPAARLVTLRRLALAEGQPAALDVARLVVPDMTLRRARDDYLRVGEREFRYAGGDGGVPAVMSVDENMALLRHPAHWEQHTGALARLLMASEPGAAHARTIRAAAAAVDESSRPGPEPLSPSARGGCCPPSAPLPAARRPGCRG